MNSSLSAIHLICKHSLQQNEITLSSFLISCPLTAEVFVAHCHIIPYFRSVPFHSILFERKRQLKVPKN